MKFKALTARFALVFSCILMTTVPASARYLQCAPFAREMSGIDIHGNANTWWSQAAGRYARGAQPQVGAVMAFKAMRRMPVGHVATVTRIVSDREVLLTHANWSRRGGIERDVRAVDVSAAGDWSQVKVYFAATGGLGTSSYPLQGFIYAGRASNIPVPAIAPVAPPVLPTMTIATSAAVPVQGGVAIGVAD